MRLFMLTVTAVTAFGALLATAQAEHLQGAPTKNGNQCFKYSPGNDKDGRFGAWGACPQAASTSTAAPTRLPPPDSRGPDRELDGRGFPASH
jgi:hypothetical protein